MNELFKITHSVLDNNWVGAACAQHYDLEANLYCELLHRGMNDVYMLRTSSTQYAVRAWRANWRTMDDVAYELEYLDFLRDSGIGVAPAIRTKDGRHYFTVEAPEGPRALAVFEWAPGRKFAENMDEDVAVSPQAINEDYGKSKALATLLIQEAIDAHIVQATILHPTGVIGPYDFKISNIGQVIKAYKTKATRFYIDGTYDFVDVRDVSLATIAAINDKPPNDRYILSGHQVSVFQLLEYLSILSGRNAPSIKIPVSIAKSSALLAGYGAYFIGKTTNFTKESIATLTSGATFDSSLAAKHLGHIPRDWTTSVRDHYRWF